MNTDDLLKSKTIVHTVLVYKAEESNISATKIQSYLSSFLGDGYNFNLSEDGDYVEFQVTLPHSGYYDIYLNHASLHGLKKNLLLIDEYCYSEITSHQTKCFEELKICTSFFSSGSHKVKILKSWGDISIDSLKIVSVEEPEFICPDFKLSNPNSSKECKALMHYLKSIYGKKIITGQHTSAASGPELDYIRSITNKLPALRGFDLLSYSLWTQTENPSQSVIDELKYNEGTIEKAIEWYNDYNGIVTICWHWFSPLQGRDKSFYTEFTDFNLDTALINGTKEHEALIADLDEIAKQLKHLRDANVPVLWRPLHEADGKWFWWGVKGTESYKKLYHIMYDRYTNYHALNNLIWVWNAPEKDCYPGDDYIDIASIDIYAPQGNYGPLKNMFDYTMNLTLGKKPVTLAENGAIPDPDKLIETKTAWLWYMPWWGDIAMDGIFTSRDHLKKVYNHAYCITLEDLPNFKN